MLIRGNMVFVKESPDRKKANSTLRHLRTNFRSMMAEVRLDALTFVYIHRDIFFDYNKIIDIYTSKYSLLLLIYLKLTVIKYTVSVHRLK